MLWLAGIVSIAALPWLAELALFRKNLLLLLWWLLIPLSVPVMLGGSKIAASEVLLLFWLSMLFWQSLPAKLNRVLRHPVSILLILEIIIYAFATLHSSMPLISLKRFVVHSLYILGGYFIFTAIFSNKLLIHKMASMLSLGIVPVLISSLYFLGLYQFSSEVAPAAPRPFFADHTEFGAFAAFLLPLAFVTWRHRSALNIELRPWQKLLVPVLVVAVLFCFSRAVWLSAAASFVFYILVLAGMRFRHLLLILILAGAVLYSYSGEVYRVIQQNESESDRLEVVEQLKSVGNVKSDVSNLERINRWKSALKMFAEKPLLGFGPGTYQFQYAPYQDLSDKTVISTNFGDAGNAHSEYLMYLSETGIFGFTIFVLLCFYLLYTGLRLYHKGREGSTRYLALGLLLGLSSFLVHSLFNSFLETDKIGLIFYLFVAALVALDLNNRSHRSR